MFYNTELICLVGAQCCHEHLSQKLSLTCNRELEVLLKTTCSFLQLATIPITFHICSFPIAVLELWDTCVIFLSVYYYVLMYYCPQLNKFLYMAIDQILKTNQVFWQALASTASGRSQNEEILWLIRSLHYLVMEKTIAVPILYMVSIIG